MRRSAGSSSSSLTAPGSQRHCLWRPGQRLKHFTWQSCDLGLQDLQVETQTVFELPSFSINTGDVKARKSLSSPSLAHVTLPAALWKQRLIKSCLLADPTHEGDGDPDLTVEEVDSGRSLSWSRGSQPPRRRAQPWGTALFCSQVSCSTGRVCARGYLYHIFHGIW